MSLLLTSATKDFFSGIKVSCKGLYSSPVFATNCVSLDKLLTLAKLQSPGLFNVHNQVTHFRGLL